MRHQACTKISCDKNNKKKTGRKFTGTIPPLGKAAEGGLYATLMMKRECPSKVTVHTKSLWSSSCHSFAVMSREAVTTVPSSIQHTERT